MGGKKTRPWGHDFVGINKADRNYRTVGLHRQPESTALKFSKFSIPGTMSFWPDEDIAVFLQEVLGLFLNGFPAFSGVNIFSACHHHMKEGNAEWP